MCSNSSTSERLSFGDGADKSGQMAVSDSDAWYGRLSGCLSRDWTREGGRKVMALAHALSSLHSLVLPLRWPGPTAGRLPRASMVSSPTSPTATRVKALSATGGIANNSKNATLCA